VAEAVARLRGPRFEAWDGGPLSGPARGLFRRGPRGEKKRTGGRPFPRQRLHRDTAATVWPPPPPVRLRALQGARMPLRPYGLSAPFELAPPGCVEGHQAFAAAASVERHRGPLVSLRSPSEYDRIGLWTGSRPSTPFQGSAPFSACGVGKRLIPGLPRPGWAAPSGFSTLLTLSSSRYLSDPVSDR